MINQDNNSATDKIAIRKEFEAGLVEEKLTENGIPFFVIRDGLDLAQYALLAKQVLEAEKLIAHDFTSDVVNESGTERRSFDYESGWFLEGISGGEVE
ncbi:hypothetical protein [Pedobacter sp. BMA]|uniref:hypothetical protein n=1 Tax=Pedobacter sp. BMA TaxID=1663685 RepID=UPI00064956B4|nr:hypothetical protein [Pedobacter sp. BMA]KLT67327.1 hypothetical protein AB669_01025 [Pedobacter sp. BMA]